MKLLSSALLPALALLITLSTLSAPAAPAAETVPLDPKRIAEIEALLPSQPAGIGPRITDRAAWEKLASLPAYKKLLTSADKALAAPVPDLPDSLYLFYTQTGDRDQWQSVAFNRRNTFQQLVLAECIRNDGRYIPKITEYLHALCAENTWVYPAHDGNLANFKKTAIDIDLGASTLGWNIATATWMLGDKLDPASRQLVAENLQRRLFTPFQERYTGKKPFFWWMTSEMNWNSVCLAGTLGAALAALPDKHTRAEFAAAAELYSAYFLKGFPADGYCTEGLGYWNYGFGRYVMLSETLRQATSRGPGGKDKAIDLLARPAAAEPARFGQKIQIMHAISPAFADCPINAKPDNHLMYYLNNYFPLGLSGYGPDTTSEPKDINIEAIYRFDNAATQRPWFHNPIPPATPRLRDFFDKAGILVARPASNSACLVGVALKGGNNNEAHNHNDIGSYVYLQNDRELILDPGPERYTSRTFSAKRYDSKLLNSFGHDVPLVAGQLQRTGKEAQAKVLQTDFSDDQDTFSLDITSAYDVPELKSLTRTWVYSRKDAGRLTVTDKVTFTSPQNFGTALITLGKWSTLFTGQMQIEDGPQAALITLTTSAPFVINPETIKENAVVTPNRIGINLKDKVTTATITLTIVPR